MRTKKGVLKQIIKNYKGKGGPTSVRTPNVPYQPPKPVTPKPRPKFPTPPGRFDPAPPSGKYPYPGKPKPQPKPKPGDRPRPLPGPRPPGIRPRPMPKPRPQPGDYYPRPGDQGRFPQPKPKPDYYPRIQPIRKPPVWSGPYIPPQPRLGDDIEKRYLNPDSKQRLYDRKKKLLKAKLRSNDVLGSSEMRSYYK